MLESSRVETLGWLLVQGIVNSLSVGILMYNVYCELIGADINMDKEFKAEKAHTKILCFSCLYVGTAAMAYLSMYA